MNPSHRNPDNLSDFRDEAAAASARLLVERGAVAPLEAGISLCLQGEEGGREALLRMRQITTVRLILGNLALIPGLVILVISQIQVFRERESNWPLTLGAIVLMFLGTAIMLAGPPLHQGLVRRWTRNRPDVFHPGPDDPRPIPVEIENRETFKKLKLMPDDLALVGFDRQRRRLVIEGVLYRYIIQTDDIVSMAIVRSMALPALQIVYTVGAVQLGLSLTPDTVTAYLRHNTIGGKSPLARPVSETLGRELA